MDVINADSATTMITITTMSNRMSQQTQAKVAAARQPVAAMAMIPPMAASAAPTAAPTVAPIDEPNDAPHTWRLWKKQGSSGEQGGVPPANPAGPATEGGQLVQAAHQR